MAPFNNFAGDYAEDLNFFRPVPYRNYFQYPPMLPYPQQGSTDITEALGLDTQHKDDEFTVFVSVPYCRVRCYSCSYFVEPLPRVDDEEQFLDGYVTYLEQQLEKYGASGRFSSRRCGAVYFGGGTASLLSPRQIERLIGRLKANFDLPDGCEVTLEGNPHEFTGEYLSRVRSAGVTRVSLGYQSFQDTILQGSLNSPHTADESSAAVNAAMRTGFKSVNVDLLYRVPRQTFAQWQAEIEHILSLSPESFTAYEYVVHKSTTAEGMIAKGRLPSPASIDQARAWYRWTREMAALHGYAESSGHAFFKPGHHQRYAELTYGTGTELIGIGAKAYSYINGYQFAAPRRVDVYKRQVDEGKFPGIAAISPMPTSRNLMERCVIFSLRRRSQLDALTFLEQFGESIFDVFGREISFLHEQGVLSIDPSGIALTELGREWRNNVLEIFYDPTFK